MDLLLSSDRFSVRADNYAKYRPDYPESILKYLENTIFLNNTFSVADIGAGTGHFSKLFLDKGYKVSAVEPNEEMRKQMIYKLGDNQNFECFPSTAENTSLPDNSIDIITVAQAFHWFDPIPAIMEFERILKPSGHILLVWNIMDNTTPFMQQYVDIKDRYSEAIKPPYKASLASLRSLFEPAPVIENTFDYEMLLDFEGLKGQLISHSIIPLEGEANHELMISELRDLFMSYSQEGKVCVKYITKVYLIPTLKA